MVGPTDLSRLIDTMTKLDRYSPKVLKKAMILQVESPACQVTVMFQPISSGIIRKVTCNTNTFYVYPPYAHSTPVPVLRTQYTGSYLCNNLLSDVAFDTVWR